MKRNKRVYLSGRMSGLPRDMWRWRFASWKVLLQWDNRDMRIVNPANTIIARHPWLYRLLGYRFTLWYDLRLLKRCTHICMIGKDWQQSRILYKKERNYGKKCKIETYGPVRIFL